MAKEKRTATPSESEVEPSLRIYDATPSFQNMILTIANRQVTSRSLDAKNENLASIATLSHETVTDGPVIDTTQAREILQEAIADRFKTGRIIVINNGVDRTVTGFQLTEQGVEFMKIKREGHVAGVVEHTTLASDTGLTVEFEETGEFRMGIQGNKAGSSTKTQQAQEALCITIPAVMRAGQQCSIATADVVTKEEDVETTFDSDAYRLKWAYPDNFEVMAVNGLWGLFDVKGTYLEPSGWYISQNVPEGDAS